LFSPAAVVSVQHDSELSGVAEIAVGPITVGGRVYTVGAVDPVAAQQDLHFDTVEGSYANFAAGTILVDGTTAAEHGWHAGIEIPVTFPDGHVVLQRIAVVYQDNRLVGSYVVSLASMREHDPGVKDAAILADNAPGVPVATALASLKGDLKSFPTLEATTEDAFVSSREQQVNAFIVVITALLVIVVCIALLGISNTLMLAVFERTREIGLLRAIGLLPAQVRAMVWWEAISIALTATAAGLVLGGLMAWAAIRALAGQGLGSFDLPVLEMIAVLIFAPLLGICAAFVPARRAARLKVLKAIASD